MDVLDVATWLNLLTQTSRFITIDTPATGGLIVERFTGTEGVNRDFRFTVDCISASAFLDTTKLLKQPVSLGLATDAASRRTWHGYITGADFLGADGGLARYQLTVESGLAFLRQRRNALIFQDQTAQEVIDQVLADYPQLGLKSAVTESLRTRPICTQFRETDFEFVTRLLGEEGLAYRFEHTQGAAGDGPGHTLVIFDTAAELPTGTPTSIRFHRISAAEQLDAISVFAERRAITSSEVTAAAWKHAAVQSIAGNAEAPVDGDAPELPTLDVFEADRAGRFASAAEASQYATHQLDALRMAAHTFIGQGSVRTLEAGKTYTLTEHPTLSGQAFVPVLVAHLATNNLGSRLPHIYGAADAEALGHGSYRQQFIAVPSGTPLPLPHHDHPLAPGVQRAIVVGVPGDALTGTRDHQVRVQFAWQRGVAPLPGGLTDTVSAHNPKGHAPGDQHSGTWVRVAEANAGAHHGHSFVPRIGDEVLVDYAHGDIDAPVVIGQLYNGPANPVFAAGENSGANHPGTLSGVQTQTLDGSPSAQWVLDDASGQLRHSLGHSIAASQLATGYLINQQGSQRGGFLGEGFALTTTAWTIARAGEGLLVSGTARSQGQSTQMDAAESVAQLKGAEQTNQRLAAAAAQATATPLAAQPAQTDLQRLIDPRQDGKYQGAVNGQASTKPSGAARSGGAPVEKFAAPAIVLEGPERIAFTTPQSASVFAGTHQHWTAQRDAHFAAGATLATASGDATGLYAADGGMNLIANHGPVSIEAHTDALQILADKDVTVTSTTQRIDILAKHKIVLQAGQSSVTLDGQNLTLACPGTFTVKTGTHQWLAGESQAANTPTLPSRTTAATIKKIGDIISAGEGGYESYNTGTKDVPHGHVGHSYIAPPTGTVTGKTINQIIATGSLPGTDKDRLFATGKYQTTIPTLEAAKRSMHLSGNEPYNADMQERVFSGYLVKKAGGGALYRYVADGSGSADAAQDAAAKEWASIAVPAGLPTESGAISDGAMSYYESAANHANPASTTALRTLLQQLRTHP